MILVIPIIIYIFLVLGLIILSNQISENKKVEERKRSRKRIIIFSAILFPVLSLLYLSYLFGVAFEDHYNVRKGTFLWYATMDNETITEFPVIEPCGMAIYNSIGGDNPNIATGWEIKYTSKKNIEDLSQLIIKYLQEKGFTINEVDKTQYYWKEKYVKNEINYLYAGYNKKGEALDVIFYRQSDETTGVECTIVY